MLQALLKGLEANKALLIEKNALIEGGEYSDDLVEEIQAIENKIEGYEKNIADLQAKAEENRIAQEEAEAKEKAENDAKIAAADKAMEDLKNGVGGDNDGEEGEGTEGEGAEPATNKAKIAKEIEDLKDVKLDVFGKNMISIIENGIKKSVKINSIIKKDLLKNPKAIENSLKRYVANAMARIDKRFQKENGISIKEGAGIKLINTDSIIDIIMADRCGSDEFLSCIPLTNVLSQDEFEGSKSWKKTIRDARSLVDNWTDLAFDDQCDASDYCAPCENSSMQIQIVYECLYGSCFVNKMAKCLSTEQLVQMSVNTLTQNFIDTVIFNMFRDDGDAVNNVNASDLPDVFDPSVDWNQIRKDCPKNHRLKYPRRKVNGGGYVYRNPAVTKDSPRGLLATAVKGPLYCNEDGKFVYGKRTVIDAKTKLQETDLTALIRSVNCGDKSQLKIFVNDCGEEQIEDMECFQCNKYLIAQDGGRVRDVPMEYKGVQIRNIKHLPNSVTEQGTVSTVCKDNNHCLIMIVNMSRLYLGYPCATENEQKASVKGTNVEIGGAFAYGLNDAPLNDKPAVCAMIVDKKDTTQKETGEEEEVENTSPKNCVKNNNEQEASELRIVSTVVKVMRELGVVGGGIADQEDKITVGTDDGKGSDAQELASGGADTDAKKAEKEAKAKAKAEAKAEAKAKKEAEEKAKEDGKNQ